MSVTLAQAFGGIFLALGLWIILRKLSSPPSALDNLSGPPAPSLITGNFGQLRDYSRQAEDFHVHISEKYGGALRFTGPFSQPFLYVSDPTALTHILLKDRDTYGPAESSFINNYLAFGMGLPATQGDHHRKQRKMMNPVFTAPHMKRLVPGLYSVVHKLRTALEAKVEHEADEVEIASWISRTALEMMGQTGFGYSFDSLTEGGAVHPFSNAIKKLSTFTGELLPLRLVIIPLVFHWGTPQFRRLLVDVASFFWGNLRSVRDIIDVMAKTSLEIYEAKKAALQRGDQEIHESVDNADDIISILMKANMEAAEENRLPDSEVLGQIATLTFAAVDTGASAMCRAFYLLSKHPVAQERLRKEVLEAKVTNHGAELDYETVMNLPYLNAVVKESLRLHPPLVITIREAKADGLLPLYKPVVGVDGKQISEVVVPKGTQILISMVSANRNTDLWGPDAHEWKPERWLVPLPDVLVDAKIPGVYHPLMTFLGGPRSCIGVKLAELELKIMLAVLVERLRFRPSGKNIAWPMESITHPVVLEEGYDPRQPQLPIIVEKVN